MKPTDHETLFPMIGILGGLNKKELVKQWGLDPKTRINSRVGFPVLRANDSGLDIDSMVELLTQNYFLKTDDLTELEDKFFKELHGEKQYSLLNDQFENEDYWNRKLFEENSNKPMIDADLLMSNVIDRIPEMVSQINDKVREAIISRGNRRLIIY